MKILKEYLFFIFFLTTITLKGQSIKEINTYVDSEIGIQNSYVFNGKIYINPYKVLSKKNQFLNYNTNYTKGSVTIQNITFKELELQYDLYSQEIIVKPDSKTSLYGIVADTSKIERFTIYDLTFVNLKNTGTQNLNGYYELSVDKAIPLYIKHKTNRYKLLDKNSVHFEFEPKYEYYIFNNDTYINVASKKDLIKIFPYFKKELKLFYSKNIYLEKNEPREFMRKLILYTNKLKDVINEK
ncbi:hypothetical protein [Flavobacterium sp. J27]|uniref:hypothetical protein n=1 Tax=Flavobacterium sp. J27 TaxID=2060419 RepID=UPI0010320D7A|nr:hypothetical protein [Flavobacterium sp. J27]